MKDIIWEEYFIRMGIIIVATWLFIFISKKLLRWFFDKTNFIEEKKEETIFIIYKTSSNFLGFLLVVIAAIDPFFDLSKVLAGAGVLGVVIGFGAKSLIEDIITGFFMISERQIHKGDFVTINQKYKGTVEEIGLRVLRIRQWDGNQLIIPNRLVQEILNGNMAKRRMVEPVVVSFRESPAHVISVLEEVCEELKEVFEDYLLLDKDGNVEESFQVRGVSKLNSLNHGYEYTVIGLIQDEHYFDVVWEARNRIAQKLFDENIKMAEENVRYHARTQTQKDR